MQTIKLEHLKLQADSWVLDLGCGLGRHTHAVAMLSNANVVGIDINPTDVCQARNALATVASTDALNRAHWCAGDGQKLPFANASFDAIICSEVLEHIDVYNNFLTEINRLLKPGGNFALSVPRHWPEWLCWKLSKAYPKTPGGHIRIFRARKLKTEVVNQLGLKFFSHHWAHALHSPYWWLRCAFWNQGEQFWPVRTYHRLLVWDLLKKPKFTQTLERLLNPVLGKSVVMYFSKTPSVKGPNQP